MPRAKNEQKLYYDKICLKLKDMTAKLKGVNLMIFV